MPEQGHLTEEEKGLFKPQGPEKGALSETEGKPPVENGEVVLTLEEFQNRYPNIKLKAQIGGQEVVGTAKDFVEYRQRYEGLERSSERKVQELSRVLNEAKQEVERIKSANAKPAAEPEDPDNPEHFVKKVAGSYLEPKITALEEKLNRVVGLLEPEIEEAQAKRAKSLLERNQIDASDFDNMKEPILRFFEKRIGREIETSEIPQIPAEMWMQGYLLVSHNSKPKAEPRPKTEPSEKIIVKREGPVGGGGGYPRTETSTNKDLEDAQKTGDFTKLLAKRGVKPRAEE